MLTLESSSKAVNYFHQGSNEIIKNEPFCKQTLEKERKSDTILRLPSDERLVQNDSIKSTYPIIFSLTPLSLPIPIVF